MHCSPRTLAKIVLPLAAAGAAAYWLFFAPVAVRTVVLGKQTLVDTVFGTGTLQAKTVVAISPRSTGQLAELLADQGDEVRAGSVVCMMAADDLRQQLRIAENELAVTRAVLKRLDAEITAAQATCDYSRRAYQRSERLQEVNVQARAEFDKQTEALKVATAVLAKAEAQKAEAELTMAKQSAQIGYSRAKLAETELVAPFDGVVLRRNRERGAVVNPGVSIMEIAATDEIWASVWVDESAVSRLRTGQRAEIVFRSEPARRYSGTVRRISRETDRETRELLVDLALDRLPENWTLGQRLEARIATGEFADRLCVPTGLLRWEKNRPFVMAVSGGRIVRRPVRLGLQTPEMTEIVSGLSPGDRAVLAPDGHLTHDGRRAESAEP